MSKHHHNLLLLSFGLIIALAFSQFPPFNKFIEYISQLGYLGAILSGILFTSTFTVATGGLLLINLSNTLNPLALILFGAMGAVIADVLIFHFVKDNISAEVTPIYEKIFGTSSLKKNSPHSLFFLDIASFRRSYYCFTTAR